MHRDRIQAALGGVLVLLLVALGLVVAGGGHAASLPPLPTNDLQAVASLSGYPTPTPAAVQLNPEPKLAASPRARCGRGSHPLAGEQGRVTAADIASAQGALGWTCNTAPVARFATPGGFRVWRFVDRHGHVCAFYDTSITAPGAIVSLAAGPSPGVEVLDMGRPAHPVETAVLSDVVMRSPHESLNLNPRRGLLAADLGDAGSYPGLMALYDVSQDCRHPAQRALFQIARFGHESGFSPDGNTFWIGGGEGIAAVDVRNPSSPRNLWEGNVFAHGLNLSDNGRVLYDTDPIDGNLGILDVSQIQQRRAAPQVREISRLSWGPVSIPQNTDPLTIHGRRYLLEFDEFAFRFNPATQNDVVGGARIIDIQNLRRPRVVANLRLAVNMQANHAAADGDPSPLGSAATTYASHYCAVPREVDPVIVACSFINSGLRIFNIADPRHPREVAYFIAPPRAPNAATPAGDAAMSQPAFDPDRRQVWYTDAESGFHVVQLTNGAWPAR